MRSDSLLVNLLLHHTTSKEVPSKNLNLIESEFFGRDMLQRIHSMDSVRSSCDHVFYKRYTPVDSNYKNCDRKYCKQLFDLSIKYP